MKYCIIALMILACLVACGKEAEKPKPGQAISQAQKAEPKQVDPMAQKLAALGKNLKDAAQEGVELSDEQIAELEELFQLVLPKAEGDLAGYTWEISCSKGTDDKDVFYGANLYRPKGEAEEAEQEKVMWFHIIYNPHMTQEEKDGYGTEDLDGYKGMGAKDEHFFVLVGNTEIRAVADSEDFKSDEKIKGVIRRFALKKIASL